MGVLCFSLRIRQSREGIEFKKTYWNAMKSKVLIGLLTLIWLVLMADIIFHGTDGKWMIADAEKIGRLEVAKYTNQIMAVSVSNDAVRLCMYERKDMKEQSLESTSQQLEAGRKTEDTARWQLVLETEAVIGKNGLGKTKEGDGKTPVGVFLFVEAFGILEDPGTQMEYIKVEKSHYWVDDSESSYYNQLVSTDEVVGDWLSAEHIVEYEESYHYVLATSYNIERIRGKGSAVFLHCTSEMADATEGCIAVPEVYMREILRRIEPECVLIIDQEENVLDY